MPIWCDSDQSMPDFEICDTSRLPPPRSIAIQERSPRSTRARIASQTRRASSVPVIVCSRMPHSRRIRSTSSGPFFDSRTALVATARYSPIPRLSSERRKLAIVATAAVIVPSSSRPVTKVW